MIDYYEEMNHSEKLRDGRDKQQETVLQAFISVVALVSQSKQAIHKRAVSI